jgi:adenylate cyclase
MFSVAYQTAAGWQRRPLTPGETTVGRSPSSDFQIDHASVSRLHARFEVVGEHCRVTDCGSHNGTYVNGELVTRYVDLKDGDVVTLGKVAVRLSSSVENLLSLSDEHEPRELDTTLVRSVDVTREHRPSEVDAAQLLGVMSELARSLIRGSSVAGIMERVVEIAFTATTAERAFLMLRDLTGASLIPQVVRNRDGTQPPATTVSRTLVRRVVDERVAILGHDAQADFRLQSADSVHAAATRSFLCAPIWDHSDVIGIVYLDSRHKNAFSATQLEFLSVLSNYTAIAIAQAHLSARVLEETRQRERLQRYHSPAVVERILQQRDEGHFLVTQEQEVTIIFADIVGFTPMSEGMTPVEVTRVLNRYLSSMCDVILEHDGTIDKFIGDAILAVFGVPLQQQDHARRAARAALGMRSALRELNAEHTEVPLEMRIAMNSGTVTAGDIGSKSRREYTVLGDTVNTCARLQTEVCQPGQIVLSRATYDLVGDSMEVAKIGFFKLKGKQQDTEVFELS